MASVPIDLLCPMTIGRASEIDAIQRFLDRGGRPLLLVSGEAGLGKSRLVTETEALAAQRAIRVLIGRCFEQDQALPYAPIVDALRGFSARPASSEKDPPVTQDLVELDWLLPGLARHLANSSQDRRPIVDMDRYRLFLALADFFGRLCSRGPLLFIVEDAHWSDDTSLEFLLYLARRMQNEPFLMLLSYRSDEVTPALQHTLATFDRERLAAELALRPLAKGDVEAMLRRTLNATRPIASEFLQTIYELSEGNPFFIEEILSSLASSGGLSYVDGSWQRLPVDELRIPRSVKDAVQRRWQRLTPKARQVLRLAAVSGRRFDFELLEVLTGDTEADLFGCIGDAIAAQLVTEESADSYAFRHALTREAIYSDILARERRLLHRQVAEVIERLSQEQVAERVADLSYHFFEADEWSKALTYASQAGDRAQRLFSPRAAIAHFSRAIVAAGRLTVDPPTAILRARGAAHEMLGAFDAARVDYESALAQAITDDEGSQKWAANLDLGMLWAERDYDRAVDYYRRAVDLARALADPIKLAHSFNRIGNWHVNVEEPFDALAHHGRALAIFEEHGDVRGVAESLDLLGMAGLISGDLIRSTQSYERAVTLLTELDHRQALGSSLSTLCVIGIGYQDEHVPMPSQSHQTALGRGERALRIAREIGSRPAEAYALWTLASRAASGGEYTRALDLGQSSLALAEEIGHRQWVCGAHFTLAAIYLELSALAEARENVEDAWQDAREIGSKWWDGNAASLFVHVAIAQGDLSAADQALESVTLLARPGSTALASGKLTSVQRSLVRVSSELALAKGDAASALDAVESLIANPPNPSVRESVACLSLLRARALLALSRPRDALDELERALTTAIAQPRLLWQWETHAAIGRVQASVGEMERADVHFAAARTLIDQLLPQIPEGVTRDRFLQHATAGFPPTRPSPVATRPYDGLTTREREVASLVSRGMTNRSIAEQLILSERTVESHVANILAKLGYASRGQIIAWAVQRGLRPDPR